MIAGFATPRGTQDFARKHSFLQYNELGKTGLLVSQAGFGCYRVDVSVEEHRQALGKALSEGINLIDTSSNYADGGSEALVGKVMGELVSAGTLVRESVVVVSKVGYLQGQNYDLSQRRKQEGKPFQDLVLYAEGLEHCIHPEFLEDQLTRSLDRLNLQTLDVYLLHNPEYYLGGVEKRGMPVSEARAEYYRRIESAFRYLESEVEGERIRWYGISSNTFPAPSADFQFTSLEKVFEIAESISSRHHFRVAQLPINLCETGGVTEKNQSTGQSVIEFARDTGLAILTNRPFNAIVGNALIRLATVEPGKSVTSQEISNHIEELIRSEDHFKRFLLPQLNLPMSTQNQLSEWISTGFLLKDHWRQFGSYNRWRDLRSQFFFPRIHGVIQFLTQLGSLPKEIALWLQSYEEEFLTAFESIGWIYQEEAFRRSSQLKSRVDSVDGDWKSSATLSQAAIRALRSTSGITTVLVGMRQNSYVDDVLGELSQPVDTQPREESWRVLKEAECASS